MEESSESIRIRRDNPTIGLTFKEQTGCGSSFFSIKFNWQDKVKLIEVFCGSSSKGGCSSNTKMTGRLVSLALQNHVPVEEILDQLESEICPTARYRAGRDEGFKKTGNSSCSKALASAIKKTLQAQAFFECHQDELKKIFSSGEVPKIEKPLKVQSKSQEEQVACDPEACKVTPPVAPVAPVAPVPQKYILDIKGNAGKGDDYWVKIGICPDCRATLAMEEGCVTCKFCGFSKC